MTSLSCQSTRKSANTHNLQMRKWRQREAAWFFLRFASSSKQRSRAWAFLLCAAPSSLHLSLPIRRRGRGLDITTSHCPILTSLGLIAREKTRGWLLPLMLKKKKSGGQPTVSVRELTPQQRGLCPVSPGSPVRAQGSRLRAPFQWAIQLLSGAKAALGQGTRCE